MKAACAPWLLLALLMGCQRQESAAEKRKASAEEERRPLSEETISIGLDSDPEKDFASAESAGDLRFVGIYGLGVEVPGVPGYHEKKYTNGLKLIEGTGDDLSDMDSLQLEIQKRARGYASDYNKLVLRFLEKRPE